MSTIKLTGNYGYTPYSVSNLAAYSTIDATTASWTLANTRNSYPTATTSWSEGSGTLSAYPFKVNGAGLGLTIKGGTIHGTVPQTSDWQYTYNNSAALRIEAAPSVVIDDWRIDSVWDAIRIGTGTTNFLIDDAYITNARDDAVENDSLLSGTIRDSLFDGVFSGISLGDGSLTDGSNNVITLEAAFIHNKSYLYKGKMTHVSPFKTNSAAPETTPDIKIINSVFAIEDPNHASQGRLDIAWDHVVESHGNVFLNLSDTPLSSSYPLPHSGFTILQGQQARDYWQAVKTAWLDNHDGTPVSEITKLPPLPGAAPAPVTPPPAPEPTPAPAPTPTTPTGTTGTTITDSSSSHTVTGSAGNDFIYGMGGDDKIFGKGGSDVLTGGSGKDKFFFDTALDGSVDKIADFSTHDDYLYLDNAVFTKLGSGSMSSPHKISSSWLVVEQGAHAHDANDFLVYDSGTGALSYDADGSGAGAAVHIADLSPNLNLTYYDIFVV